MAESLSDLERDVEAARARLKGDLETLRAPSTYSDFAQTVRQTAVDAKDSMIDDVRGRTVSAFEDAAQAVKAKAAANPTAALVIGAGLAWHFLRRPPITAALIGGGLISLLRTPAGSTGASDAELLAEAKANLRRQTGQMKDAATEAGHQAATLARAKASELSDQTRDKAIELSHQARDKAAELSHAAQDRAAAFADAARDKAAELSQSARDSASGARDSVVGYARSAATGVSERVGHAADSVGDAVHGAAAMLRARADEVSEQVRDGAGTLAERVRGAADEVRGSVHDALSHAEAEPGVNPDSQLEPLGARPVIDPRARVVRPSALPAGLSADRLLLGAAGLAVAAAVGLALQSRTGTGQTASAGATPPAGRATVPAKPRAAKASRARPRRPKE